MVLKYHELFALFSTPQGLIAADPVQVARAQPIVLPSLRSLMSGRGIAYMRLGALSGAAAIGMHLYYTQRKQMELKRRDYRLEDLDADQQRIFETTNLFHFVHSVVLLSAPLMRTPVFVSVWPYVRKMVII